MSSGPFAVYLRQREKYVLYTKRGQAFTAKHQQKLYELGVKEVFVQAEQKEHYDQYLSENLASLLDDEDIPPGHRAGALYESSLNVVREVFDTKLPMPLNEERLKRITKLVKAGAVFLKKPAALKSMAALIGHDYGVYSHSVNVMVFTTFLLQAAKGSDELQERAAIGAMLHDYGKCKIPKRVLEKKMADMTQREEELYRSHPNLGVGMCATVPLAAEAIHCILFHHEAENGSGYPSGLTGAELPVYVKALNLANAYDNLTSDTPQGPARRPFEALNAVKARQNQFDLEMIKRLILILADGGIV